MTKLADGSEKVRIKVSVADKIREMSETLGMSFLEVVYHAVNTYYLEHYKRQNKQIAATTVEKSHESVNQDECEVDLDI